MDLFGDGAGADRLNEPKWKMKTKPNAAKDRAAMTLHPRVYISPDKFSTMILPFWMFMARSLYVESADVSALCLAALGFLSSDVDVACCCWRWWRRRWRTEALRCFTAWSFCLLMLCHLDCVDTQYVHVLPSPGRKMKPLMMHEQEPQQRLAAWR